MGVITLHQVMFFGKEKSSLNLYRSGTFRETWSRINLYNFTLQVRGHHFYRLVSEPLLILVGVYRNQPFLKWWQRLPGLTYRTSNHNL